MDLNTNFENILAPARQTRRDSYFTAEERAVMVPFRDLLEQQSNPEGRSYVCKKHILPAIFNYWLTIGKKPKDLAEQIEWSRIVIKWLSNNWRSKATDRKWAAPNFKATRVEHVWRTRQSLVWAEIDKLLGVTESSTSTPGWFQCRQKAIANVIRNMSAEDQQILNYEVAQISQKGYPPEVQAKMADKVLSDRIEQAATEHFLEMGVISLQLTCHRQANGKLGVTIFDYSTILMGTSKVMYSFASQQKDVLSKLQASFLSYNQALHYTATELSQGRFQRAVPIDTALANAPANITYLQAESEINPHGITFTTHGYPQLPQNFSSANYFKHELSPILQTYINTHYQLASGQPSKRTRTPWSKLKAKEDMVQLINSAYLPSEPDFRFDCPRNMSLENVSLFLDFIARREGEFGAENAFRFSHISGRKGIQPALYPTPALSPTPALTNPTPTPPTPSHQTAAAHTGPDKQTQPSLPTPNLTPEPTSRQTSMQPETSDMLPVVQPQPQTSKKANSYRRRKQTEDSTTMPTNSNQPIIGKSTKSLSAPKASRSRSQRSHTSQADVVVESTNLPVAKTRSQKLKAGITL
ncbi:hypothetical protein CVT24_010960 [Panaeolus cyanescens]|uniref:Uncharacterized protein n=1 Tax=Panaeolus cyanescens TaxID=181874 RepID=A0A409YYF4_9AGAR|nr:hypothetical protein CVT24_010960 [Panaeolus cyanescens]